MEIVFETPRLLLRQFTLEDVTILLELNSNPVVLKYLHEPLLQDEAHAETILKTIILPQYERKLGRWAVHLKDDNSFLGWCGLKYRPELEEIDLGYRFMQTAWGKGFATEAAQETLEYGFKKLNLSLITGRAHIENLASIRVLEKIGMEYIGEGIIDDCPVKTFIMKNPY
jgi:RimJ/RimL family protein N-acetyltransferase